MSRTRPRRSASWARSAALLALGLLLVGLVVRHYGWESIRARLEEADRRLLGWAALLFFTQILTMGGRWWIAMRMLGLAASPLAVLRANCGSNFLNFFAPGHFGEPVMSLWLGRTRGAPGVEAFTVLVACKVVATVMNLGLLLLCLPFLRGTGEDSLLWQVGVTIAFLCLGTGGGLYVILHRRTAERAIEWGARRLERVVDRARPGSGPRVADAMRKVAGRFTETFALFARNPKTLLAVSGMSALKMGTIIGVVMLLYRAFGEPVTWFQATFLETVDVLGHLVSIWIPGNMGVQEAVMTFAAAVGLNIDGATAAGAALAHKGILFAHISLGGLLFLGLGAFAKRA